MVFFFFFFSLLVSIVSLRASPFSSSVDLLIVSLSLFVHAGLRSSEDREKEKRSWSTNKPLNHSRCPCVFIRLRTSTNAGRGSSLTSKRWLSFGLTFASVLSCSIRLISSDNSASTSTRLFVVTLSLSSYLYPCWLTDHQLCSSFVVMILAHSIDTTRSTSFPTLGTICSRFCDDSDMYNATADTFSSFLDHRFACSEVAFVLTLFSLSDSHSPILLVRFDNKQNKEIIFARWME